MVSSSTQYVFDVEKETETLDGNGGDKPVEAPTTSISEQQETRLPERETEINWASFERNNNKS